MLKISTKKLTLLAILMAMGIILKSFLSIGSSDFRISFWNIPLFISGIVCGPVYGGLCAFGADLIYGLCFSKYPFSLLMSLTCTIWGIMGGLLFNKEVKITKVIIIVIITCLLETFINSIYLYFYYDSINLMLAKLPRRLLIQFVRCILSIILIYVIYHNVFLKNLRINEKQKSRK